MCVPRTFANAIFAPLDDQAGSSAVPTLGVWSCADPFAVPSELTPIVKTSPVAVSTYAIVLPSGDHDGSLPAPRFTSHELSRQCTCTWPPGVV